MTARLTPRDVIDRLTDGSLTSRHADKWGESMMAHFTIAHALDAYSMVPGTWGFRGGMGAWGFDAIEDPYTRKWIRKVRPETLQRAGEILHRYEHLLERAGHSY